MRRCSPSRRNFANRGRHPGRYQLTLDRRFRSMMRRRRCAARQHSVPGCHPVFGLDDKSGVHVGRALRAAIHGFVTLESGHGIGNEGTDESSGHIELLSRGLRPATLTA